MTSSILAALVIASASACSGGTRGHDPEPDSPEYERFVSTGGGATSPATALPRTWYTISTLDAPTPRKNYSAISTGQRLIIWSGTERLGYQDIAVSSGAVLDVASNVWTPIRLTNAPRSGAGHSASWTGSEMLVFGGAATGNSGGVYDPVANQWRAMSLEDAPAERSRHFAAWTGTRLLIYGGYLRQTGAPTATGALYDPTTDVWSPLDMTDGPDLPLTTFVHELGVLHVGPASNADWSPLFHFDSGAGVWSKTALVGGAAQVGTPVPLHLVKDGPLLFTFETSELPDQGGNVFAMTPSTWTFKDQGPPFRGESPGSKMTYDEPYLFGVRTCRAENEEGDWRERAKRVRVFRQNATDATFVELTFEGAPLQRCQPTILPIAGKLVVWGGYTYEEVVTEPASTVPAYIDTPVSTGAIYTD